MADLEHRAIGSLLGLLSATVGHGQTGGRRSLSGLSDPFITLVNVAPIAIRWHGWSRIAQEQASLQARALGANDEGIEASENFVRILTRALWGYSRHCILEPFDWLGEPAVAVVAQGGWRKSVPAVPVRTAADALATTLWIVAAADGFDDAMEKAIALDCEGSTVLAVSQLAGAIWPLQMATSPKVNQGLSQPVEGIVRALLAAHQR